jgi:hypothetical protein
MNGREDLITSMQTAVKLEVVEYYFRERRIIEEEIAMVFEGGREYHTQLALWRKERDRMLTALFSQQNIHQFIKLSGLAPLERCCLLHLGKLKFQRPAAALTRQARYRRLIERLYTGLHRLAREINEKKAELLNLCREVNQDIARFEMNHDLLSITAYLRSLNPAELQKRNLLGVNFTAWETAAAAAALSFRPINHEVLGLDQEPDPLLDPGVFMPKVKSLLKKICNYHAKEVDSLFISR